MDEETFTNLLFNSLERGDCDEFKQLLKKAKGSPDNYNKDGMTLLMQAAYKGEAEICKYLIDCGASVNATEHENYYTALMMACLAGKTNIVQLLLDHGADIGKTNSIGKTAVQLASFVGQHDAANLMKNYISLDKLAPYTESQGANEPRLSKTAAADVQKLITLTNPHPLKLILTIMDSDEIRTVEGLKQTDAVFSDLLRKAVRSNDDFDEILAMKLHYFSSIVLLCIEHIKKHDSTTLDLLVKHVLRTDGDGFQVAVEQLLRKAILGFPYTDFPIMQQYVKTIHSVKVGSNPTSLSCLMTMFNGMHSSSQRHNTCEACAENASPLRCSACKTATYCSKRCQKIHWFVHKKFCKKTKT